MSIKDFKQLYLYIEQICAKTFVICFCKLENNIGPAIPIFRDNVTENMLIHNFFYYLF